MSDGFAVRRYHRQNIPVLGASRKKKYLKIFLVLMLAGSIAAAYYVHSSGFLTDRSREIPGVLLERINLERQANNLPPVQAGDPLPARTSGWVPGSESLQGAGSNTFTIPGITWAIAGQGGRQQVFDALENDDSSFRANILNSDFTRAGIGVTSDGYNYHVRITWQ